MGPIGRRSLAAVNRRGIPIPETFGPCIVGPKLDHLVGIGAQDEGPAPRIDAVDHGSLRGDQVAIGSGRQSDNPIAGPVGVAAGAD